MKFGQNRVHNRWNVAFVDIVVILVVVVHVVFVIVVVDPRNPPLRLVKIGSVAAEILLKLSLHW